MIKKNQVIELKIDGFTNEGMGVGRADSMAVFVPYTVPDDVAEVLIVKVKSSYAYGKCLSLKSTSTNRRTPLCSAFGRCGGCKMMHIDYAFQLKLKERFIYDALVRIGGADRSISIEMLGASDEFMYRNKTVYPIGEQAADIVCGFYAERSHNIVPLTGCPLSLHPDDAIIGSVLDYMKEFDISPYNEAIHTGFVRRLFIRRGKNSGETMVVLSANAAQLCNEAALVNRILSSDSSVVSIILNTNQKPTNLVLGEKSRTLYGTGFISDTLCGNEYKISPHSFFQVNPMQTERLYTKALEYTALGKNETLMDIYCGIGTISLAAAPLCGKVIGIEIVPDAISDARRSAKQNNISNVEFFTGSAEEIVPNLINSGISPDAVILDPPRKGSDNETLTAIISAAPKRITYISCNPTTLARDIKFLSQNGYTLKKITGIDMFPQTLHVECVVCMQRKDTSV